MNTKIVFTAIVLVLFSSCQQRLSISKKYHSFGWNIALESKQDKTEKSVTPTKRKKKEQIISESLTQKQDLPEEKPIFSAVKNEQEAELIEQFKINKSFDVLKTKQVSSVTNYESKKTPQFLKNQQIKKAQKQGIKETHESGALKTLGWILIILGLIFILIISILLGFMLCLLGLLFILVGK
jgi:thiol:disulfide interchange protein